MSEKDSVLEKIRKLEALASDVLDLKRSSIPRRPIVIEFCGSPKSGKSSCINSLAMFLRRNGFRVKVLSERASICPITNKYDPFFNIWTICSAAAELSEVLSNSPKEFDVIIMDRGIFDALCWFEWLADEKYFEAEELKKVTSFLLMNKWRAAIDLILIFESTPSVSIEREYAALLTRKRGSIMHESILERYRFMVDVAFKKHKRKFKMVKKLDTTNINQNDVSYMVTNLVLDALHDTISEKIGYIDSEKLNQHLFSGSKDYKSGSLPLTSCMKFAGRKGVEESADKIQPIPILVITDSQRKRILTAKKNKKAAKLSSPEYGKTLLYFGGHTRDEDQFLCANKDILSVCKAALSRELKEEIGIDFSVKEIEPSMLIWSHSNERSRRHLAICFIWETDLDSLKIKFDKNEFSSGSDGANAIVNVEDLVTESLESWSMEILKKKFDVFLIQQELVLSGDGVH